MSLEELPDRASPSWSGGVLVLSEADPWVTLPSPFGG